MGVRIAFYETTDGKSLFENMTRSFYDFKNWLLIENKKSIEKYNERIFSLVLEHFLIQSENLLGIEKISRNLLDELTYNYLLAFCEYGLGDEDTKLIGPLISSRTYNDEGLKRVKKIKNKKLNKYWSYLKVGRSYYNDDCFIEQESNLIGFWNKEEMGYIKKVLNNNTYESIGIQSVIQVLDDIGDKSELIFNIEL